MLHIFNLPALYKASNIWLHMWFICEQFLQNFQLCKYLQESVESVKPRQEMQSDQIMLKQACDETLCDCSQSAAWIWSSGRAGW